MERKTKVKGVKNAVGEYNRLNKGGKYRQREGRIMLNLETGQVWTDGYERSECAEIVYSQPVVRLDQMMQARGYFARHELEPMGAGIGTPLIDVQTVRTEAERIIAEWQTNTQ